MRPFVDYLEQIKMRQQQSSSLRKILYTETLL